MMEWRIFRLAPCIAVLAVLLTACAASRGIAPQERPRAAGDLDAGRTLAAEVPDAPWPAARWWQAFGDAQLDALIDAATAGSPDLAAARARVRLALAQAGAAEAATRPSAEGKLSAQDTLFTRRSFIPPPYAGDWWWNNEAAVDFRYPLDLWGADEAAFAATRAGVRAGGAAEQAARLSLQSDLVQAYVRLALQCERLELLGQDLRNREQLVDISRQRVRAGIGTELELAQAQGEVPVARARVEEARQSIELLHHQLAALSGQGPGAGDALQPPRLGTPPATLLPSRLPAELVGRRPDLAARRWQAEAAAKNVDVARARFYPNLDLVASVGLQSLGFYHFLDSDALAANYGPALTLPIFAGGRLRAGLGARAAQYDEAVAQYNATLVQALQQVADQVTDIRGLERQQRDIEEAERSAQRAHDLALRGYRAGLGDYLNVLSAQGTLLAQQERLAALRAERLAAHARLMAALGGGLPPDKAAPAAAAEGTDEH